MSVGIRASAAAEVVRMTPEYLCAVSKLQRRFFDRNNRVGWDTAVERDTGTDQGSCTDHCCAAKNRGVAVDRDAIFQSRVTLCPANQVAVFIARKRPGSQSHALIQRDMRTDLTRFSDDNTGSMIDEE